MIALELDPTLALRTQDWGEAVERTLPQVALQSVPSVPSVPPVEPTFEELTEEEEAILRHQLQLESNPGDLEALRALAGLHFAAGRWHDARRPLLHLVDLLDLYEDRAELCRCYFRLAFIAGKLGDHRQELELYLSSFEFDTTHLPTLEGLASALLRVERWDDARRILRITLIQHKSELTSAQVVDLHYKLGELDMLGGQYDRAASWYGLALELDPRHIPTLRSHADLAVIRGNWEQVFETRELLVELLDEEQTFELLLEQVSLCRDHLEDPFRAIDVCTRAQRIRPADTRVLRTLIDLFDRTGQARRKIEALGSLIPLLTDPVQRRDGFMELARCWKEEKEPREVIDALNRALDEDHSFIEAFREIEQMLYRSRAWASLAANYRRMIVRLPKEQVKGRAILWRSLGKVYQKALRSHHGARIAYEAVLRADPNDLEVTAALAEVYSQRRQTVPRALALHHYLLAIGADPVVSARRLFELYSGLDQLDRAFCALGVLVLLGAATDTELEAHQLLLKRAPKAPSGSLSDELWRDRALHEGCKGSLGEICSILYRAAPSLFMGAQEGLGLKKKEKVDLTATGPDARARLRYFDICSGIRAVLGVDDVDHYHRPGTSDAPRVFPGAPAVLFAGELHDSFKATRPNEVRWIVTRELAALRPELAPVFALAPEELGAAIEAAIQLVSPSGSGVELPLDPRLVRAWKKELDRALTAEALESLKAPVLRCLESRELRQLARFVEGADQTTSRVAFLLAQDATVVKVDTDASKRDLALFILSEDSFLLRDALGLTIS